VVRITWQTNPTKGGEMKQEYVVGFLYNEKKDSVALIRKNRPEWQKGKLNGIGGHVENGEQVTKAMQREFQEEAGMDIKDWDLFCIMHFESCNIYFYSAVGDLTKIKILTDEIIELHTVESIPRLDTIENLKWLVPLGAWDNDWNGTVEIYK
jgi:8-oxo-dGTP diphosphatase